eukprot:scaffold34814_cov63-Phaeocystis_antarctica.AAC.7
MPHGRLRSRSDPGLYLPEASFASRSLEQAHLSSVPSCAALLVHDDGPCGCPTSTLRCGVPIPPALLGSFDRRATTTDSSSCGIAYRHLS